VFSPQWPSAGDGDRIMLPVAELADELAPGSEGNPPIKLILVRPVASRMFGKGAIATQTRVRIPSRDHALRKGRSETRLSAKSRSGFERVLLSLVAHASGVTSRRG
jgi:hypothetical protein